MEYINLNHEKYLVMKNVKEGLDIEELVKRFTDYFKDFDYLVGDWSYGKLRLKGFNKKSNKSFKSINDFSKVKDYIKNNCAYMCKYFILQRENV